jgi:large subunit ribosomal protein L19
MENTTIQLTSVDIEARKKLDIRAGDTVRVHLKIKEKDKTRIQVFSGVVLAIKHGKESGGTFTVRRVVSGVGVEKIFPIFSPSISKIEITKRSKVRRAKLYYIREKVAREIRRKMRRMLDLSSGKEEEDAVKTTENEETQEDLGEIIEVNSLENEETSVKEDPVEEKNEVKTGEEKEDTKKGS